MPTLVQCMLDTGPWEDGEPPPENRLKLMCSLIPSLVGIAVLLAAMTTVWLWDGPAQPLLVAGTWTPHHRPWHRPDDPLAPLEVSLMVCMTKMPARRGVGLSGGPAGLDPSLAGPSLALTGSGMALPGSPERVC